MCTCVLEGVLLGYLLYCWCTLVSMWVLYGWLHVVCTVHCVIMPHYDPEDHGQRWHYEPCHRAYMLVDLGKGDVIYV